MTTRPRVSTEGFDAVRAAWPEHLPLVVAISVTDCARGGLEVEDAIVITRSLKVHGCDMIEVRAGQTVPEGEPTYGRGFLTTLSDRVCNKASIATLVGGYLTTSNEINTVIAAARAGLYILHCAEIPAQPHLQERREEGMPAYLPTTITRQQALPN